jgi:cytochrome c553
MKRCARCGSQPVEWHHTQTGLGRKQLQEAWSIIALCTRCHRGEGKNDEIARHLAYKNISNEELKKKTYII